MSNKQALLVGPFPPPIGGDTVSTSNLARSRYWAEHGIVIKPLNTSAGDRVRLLGERYSVRDIARAFRIFARLSASLPRSDALMLWANSTFLCTAGIPILWFARILGKPYMVKLFGTALPDVLGRAGALRRGLVLANLKKAKNVLLQTKDLHEWCLREIGIGDADVVLFPNFIPDRLLGPLPELADPSGKCVFVGQIKREKGVFDIAAAVGDRADISCDYYGPILDRDREQFLSTVSRSDALFYRGIAEPGEITRIISRYDILLLPTYHIGEGYPAVILEAFAAGVPVITTAWRSIPDIVEDGVTGIIVPPESPGELGRAIDRLLSDRELYNAVRDGAHKVALSFSEERIVGGILLSRIERMWGEGGGDI
jgi:glycosyltransferase involved in cell wall biosynthesis